MLSDISWQGYWTTFALLAAFYYVVIILLFYSGDIKRLLHSKSKLAPVNQSHRTVETEDKIYALQPELFGNTATMIKAEAETRVNDQMYIIQNLIDELQAYFTQSGSLMPVKEELTYAIERILKKYPGIKNTPSQSSINTLIAMNCENYCSIHLSAEEVSMLWKG
jgi:hypothetical protein